METLNLIKNDPWLEPYADAASVSLSRQALLQL